MTDVFISGGRAVSEIRMSPETVRLSNSQDKRKSVDSASPEMNVETPGLASARAYSSVLGIACERTIHPLTVTYVLFLVFRVLYNR